MIEVEALRLDNIRHGFFTRHGGVSDGIYDSLNIGLGSRDHRQNVLENRARVAARLGAAEGGLALPYQHHSADAVVVDAAWPPGSAPKADAVVTSVPGLAIGVSTADCGPILFADPHAGVIGAAHAGWRGALGGVIEATVAAMEAEGAERGRIVAVLGPTISRDAYEVGAEFRADFLDHDPENARFFVESPNGRPHFDLPAYILHRLEQASLGYAQALSHCTYNDERNFFSFRRATHRGEPDYGRLVSAITLAR